MKRILFSLLWVIFLWPCSCSIATAQEPEPASSGEIMLGEGEEIQEYSTKGKFPPVTMDALQTSDVTLQFSTSMSGVPVIVQVLDGGELSGNESTTIDDTGKASLQFQVADQPGLYRVLVIAAGTVSMVQFEVPNPPE